MTAGKVVFCVPSLAGPTKPFIEAMDKAMPLVVEAGWDALIVEERQNPYISAARSIMLRKALDTKPDVVVFLDYDLSFDPEDLLILVNTPGDVVAGLYRFKDEPEAYMGVLADGPEGRPAMRPDGCILATRIPAGFMKITADAVNRFMTAYPHLCYGPKFCQSIDLFNHGAIEGIWHGEDYAFSRRWLEMGGELWVVPNLNLTHHSPDKAYPGNFLDYSMRRPGGAREGEPPWWELTPEQQRAA